jgi:hypothetical protein
MRGNSPISVSFSHLCDTCTNPNGNLGFVDPFEKTNHLCRQSLISAGKTHLYRLLWKYAFVSPFYLRIFRLVLIFYFEIYLYFTTLKEDDSINAEPKIWVNHGIPKNIITPPAIIGLIDEILLFIT